MMVDTGASLTLVTAQMASDLNVKPAGSAVFQTPGGMVNLDWGMMASIEVEGAIIGNVPVIIGLPDMRVGLLGQDFLQLFEITIREDHIEFKPKPKQRENSKV
jgi:aspartyl protease family protein